MIPEIEKRVFEKIGFTNQQLNIRKKYVDDGLDTAIFKKSEIVQIFNELRYPCKYTSGGSYKIEKLIDNYLFQCNFIISKNSVNIYYEIYFNGKFIEDRVANIGSVLRYLPYDASLITNNYGLNSLVDLRNYIKDHISLFELFVAEYIKEASTY